MAIKTYNDTNVQAIADAIRSKNFQSTTYKISEMASAISALQTGLELLPQDTVSGAIANFPDGSNGYPVVSLEADIVATQDGSGDPSPSNVRAINGFTECKLNIAGVNIFDGVLESGSISSTNGSNITGANRVRTPGYINCIGGKDYYVYKDFTETVALRFYGASKNFLGSTTGVHSVTESETVTFPENARYFRFVVVGVSLETFSGKVSVNSNANITTFQAYRNADKTISFGEAGTVYGGNLNVTTGVLTVDKELVTYDGDEDWKNNSSGAGVYISKDNRFSAIVSCSKYLRVNNTSGTSLSDNCIALNNNGNNILVRDPNAMDADTFKAALASQSMTILFDLATPVTYQLTPEQVTTLLGENNIFASTGDVAVTYRADVDLYIAKKIAEGANS